MFETTKDIYWLILGISIASTALMLSYVLYRLAKILEETRFTVKDVNKKLKKTDELFDEGVPAITGLMQTLGTINKQILRPITGVGAIFRALNIFRSEKEKD